MTAHGIDVTTPVPHAVWLPRRRASVLSGRAAARSMPKAAARFDREALAKVLD